MQSLLYNQELEEILENFYTLTGILVILYDSTQNVIVSCPKYKKKGTFCMTMKENKEFKRKCHACDAVAFEKAEKTKKLVMYTCHAKLTEAVAPILKNDRIIGYIMFGQIAETDNKELFMQELKELCDAYETNANITNLIRKIKFRSKKQINSAAKILEACVSYIQYKEMVYLPQKKLIDTVEEYIDERISDVVTVEDLCREFNISRTNLYEQMRQQFSGGVATFIRQKKLNYAKHLLNSTNMSISDVADAAGFSDYNYFLRLFKSAFGISPKQFVKSNRQQK